MPKEKKPEEKPKPDCGKRAGIPCSKLFEREYGTDRLIALILTIYKKQYKRFRPLFETWPRKKGLITRPFLELRARKLYEEILDEIKTTESKRKDYELYNFPYIIRRKAESIFVKERDMLTGGKHQITINDRCIQCFRHWLPSQEVTMEKFVELATNPNTEESIKFQEKLETIPGMAKCEFKIINTREHGRIVKRVRIIFSDIEYKKFQQFIAYGNPQTSFPIQTSPDLKQEFESFIKSLTGVHACVWENSFEKKKDNEEVRKICWDTPRSSERVDQIIEEIRDKFLIEIMGWTKEILQNWKNSRRKKRKPRRKNAS